MRARGHDGGMVAPDEPVPIRRATTPVRIVSVRSGEGHELPDTLVTEEPMEIRVAPPGSESERVAVTMRTPGHDFELAAGFLVNEGVIDPAGIAGIRYCALADQEQLYNTVTVDVRRPVDTRPARRTQPVSSACGVCGVTTLDDVAARCAPVKAGATVAHSVVLDLPARLRAGQRLFARTGGLHAAGLFTTSGELVAVREDIGRHNAVDKVVGWAALAGRVPLSDHVLMVSGRAGFEIAQKAAAAGIGVVAAVSAPSSLAVATADRLGITLIGFLRADRYNIYSHPERVDIGA